MKQSPWPLVAGKLRTEIYLHDGVRRIQEIWRTPAQGNGSQGGQNQNNEGGGDPELSTPPSASTSTRRAYVDEFVCEIDTGGPSDKFWWVLQDPNYNVVALVSDGDGSGGASPGGTYRGEVARQYSWSPYGQLLRADIYDTSAPASRLGHQGLFHDRLDADILSEPMVAFSDQTVQNRNRTLSPRLGRFLQSDPYGTALALSAMEVARHGHVDTPRELSVAGMLTFADGMNIYAYERGNPVIGRDPTGLFLAGFASSTAGRAAAAGVGVAGTAMSIFGLVNDIIEGKAIEDILLGLLSTRR